MDKLLGMPPNVSAHGGEIDDLMLYIHVLMVVIFVGWLIYFCYVLIRYRSSRQPKGDYQGAKGAYSKYIEVGVAMAEVILLVGFSIPLYSKRVSNFPNEADSVVIHVMAEQFAWNVHYPGADGIFGTKSADAIDPVSNPIGLDRDSQGGADDIVKVNQLHVPVGKPVIIHLTSKDVIHSFNLPVLRIKQDVIPGMSIPVWFEATDTIKSEIACAQLCGLGHYRMKGFLTVESQADFEAFLAKEAESLSEEDEDDFWD